MGPRELAYAVELHQRYVDLLAELEDAPLDVLIPDVTVRVGGTAVRFTDVDSMAGWLSGVMSDGTE